MNSTPTSNPPTKEGLRKSEYIGYALGDTASNFFFQTFNIFLTYYYVDVWGIPATVLLWLMPLVRAIGAVDDVLMGLIADRTNTRWGKFRPYLLFGAVPYGICGYLMFAAPALSPNGKVIYAFITYALMLMSYTVINVPYSSLLGVISPSPRVRTVASTYRFVGAFSAALLISLFVRPLVKHLGAGNDMRGFQLTMAIFAVASVVMFLITFATTRERVTPPPQQKTNVREELAELFRNWPWVMLLVASIFSNCFSALRSGSTLFFFKYVQGYDSSPFLFGVLDRSTVFLTTGAIGMVLGTACLGPIAGRIDKKYYAAGLSVVTGLCFLAFFFIPKGQFGFMIALNMLAQFCAGPTSALTWALYGDVADYGEWKYGRRSTGLIYSASLFSIKTGILVGGFLVPLFLAQFGFVRDAVQTTTAILGITLAFSIGPGIFALLKAVALFIYPLDQRKVDEIETALVSRRKAAATATPSPVNIRNPILPGFNPDPSILRVGDDYYIATSTFEWFPGVQIHHSRDLVNWRLLTRPLTRPSQLNMLGDPDSCGIWAPCLSHADGKFWLIYTDVKRYGRTSVGGASGASLRDFHNYLVTADQIDGEWSDPVYLNSSGFDPSLFHDDDGRKWYVNQLWDYRPGNNRFAGIVLQEYSVKERQLLGTRVNIFPGTSLGLTEAPHLYKRNGWYYLITAEGGTGWGHAVTMCRSRNLAGPYELHPDTTILTARHRPDAPLQRAGHADLVDTQAGETYIAYLCGRPLKNRGRCVLGRETALQPMVWGTDDWLRTTDGQGIPQLTPPAPKLPAHPFPFTPVRHNFDAAQLPIEFQWLRSPWPAELFSLSARSGHLRLFGRETIGSLFKQALVARRQQAHCYSASTVVEFEPEHFQQMAGLVCYYGAAKFHYFHVCHDETLGKHLRVMSAIPDGVMADAFTSPVPVPAGKRIELRVEVDEERLLFAYRVEGVDQDWRWLPQHFDASILSDEASLPGLPNFTGAFVGLACQDLAGTGRPADFDWFEYRERAYLANPATG